MQTEEGYLLEAIARLLVHISLYEDKLIFSRYCEGDLPVIFLKNRLKWAGSLNPSSKDIS
jgi:hypothetical protein